MNAKRQHLPPQALAGTRRQGRNTSGAPKMEKASQRDHRRPVLLHSCEAEHKRDRSVQKGTGEYIKADRSCTPTKQDMLAFTAVDHERLRIACGQVEGRAKPARCGQSPQIRRASGGERGWTYS